MNEDNTIIYGRNVRVLYDVASSYSDFEVEEIFETINRRALVFKGYLEKPLLEKGETVFIEDSLKVIKIGDRIRGLKGGYVYLTDHVVERISDEKTAKSKAESEIKSRNLIEKREAEIRQHQFDKLPLFKKLFKNKPTIIS